MSKSATKVVLSVCVLWLTLVLSLSVQRNQDYELNYFYIYTFYTIDFESKNNNFMIFSIYQVFLFIIVFYFLPEILV